MPSLESHSIGRTHNAINQHLSSAKAVPESSIMASGCQRLLAPDQVLVQKLLKDEKDERYRYLLKNGNIHYIESETYSLFVELPQIPNILIVYRRPAERTQNPEKMSLDARGLKHIPLLEGEEKIKFFHLQNNQISKIENLVSLPNLHFLDLSSNKMTEINNLPSVTNLRVLVLSRNQLTSIKNLDSFQNLEVLDLHDNKIVGSGLCNVLDFSQCFKKLKNLRVLNLSNNEIKSVEINCSMTNLRELNLRQNKIVDIKIGQMNGSSIQISLENLQKLQLSFNQISSLDGI